MKQLRAYIWAALTIWILLAIFIAWSVVQIRQLQAPRELVDQTPSEELVPAEVARAETDPTAPSLNLDIIFDDYTSSNRDTWSMVVTGDVLLARSVNATLISRKDPTFPFAHTQDILSSADLTLVNLETPLIEDCTVVHSGMRFCGQPENAAGLQAVGVDIASLANNHAKDQEEKGEAYTSKVLAAQGITPLLQGQTVYRTVQDTKVAILGYDVVWHRVEIPQLISSIKQASQNADIVIPFFSWGHEYTTHPNAQQRQLAQVSVEAGADLIIGNHPHWVQAVEVIDGVPVVYSHGNFVFDQMWSEETREGVVGTYYFSGSRLIDIHFTPIYINASYQPEVAGADKAKTILDRMRQASRVLIRKD